MDAEKEAEWAEFRVRAEEEDVGAYVEGLVRLCVPSLKLIPKASSALKSRIGGRPDLPAGFEWPRSSTDESLGFVAQVDLGEVRRSGLAGAEALPEAGLLSFFHGYEPSPNEKHTGNAGRVFFFERVTSLSPTEGPADAAILPLVPFAFEEQTEELPPLESPFYALLLAENDGKEGAIERAPDVFANFVSEYGPLGLRDEDERPLHRLLGYADPLQADVYVCTEGHSKQVDFDAWTTLAHHRAAAEWQLLLQLDSDPKREILFGDGGVLSFMIRKDDLAARRFDRVWVEWQMH
jgi:uncharacterized protein YwqG